MRYFHLDDKFYHKKLTSEEKKNAAIGLIIYFVVFIMIVPLIIYKLRWYLFLRLYFLNTDLLATVLGFAHGPFANIFGYLYGDTVPFIGYISRTLIAWSVLIGLIAYVILNQESKKPRSLSLGLSHAFFILSITYLLPNRLILIYMTKLYNYLHSAFKISYSWSGNLTLVFGVLFSIFFILLEAFCIHFFAKPLEFFLDNYFFKYLANKD